MVQDISGYIRELLFKHDCVIIPGFGAFIGNYFPAHIDRNEGLFYPPERRITFNRHLTGNDGLVIGHISSHKSMNYGDARDIVSAWAGEIKSKIEGGTPVTIDHLGTFSLNREGTTIFEPDSAANYLLSSYGLTSYQRVPLSDFDVRRKVLDHQHRPPVGQPSVKRLLTRAAVIVPVLVALALVPFNDNLFRGRMDETNLNPLAKAELEFNREQITADTSYKEPQPALNEAAAAEKPPVVLSADAKTDTEPAVVGSRVTRATAGEVIRPSQPAVIVEEYRYLVIIGSFRTEDNALTMIEKLRKSGYDPEMTGGPDGFLRVSAISFGTVEEAKVAHSRLIKSFPGAWIHKSRQ